MRIETNQNDKLRIPETTKRCEQHFLRTQKLVRGRCGLSTIRCAWSRHCSELRRSSKICPSHFRFFFHRISVSRNNTGMVEDTRDHSLSQDSVTARLRRIQTLRARVRLFHEDRRRCPRTEHCARRPFTINTATLVVILRCSPRATSLELFNRFSVLNFSSFSVRHRGFTAWYR